MQVWHVGKEGSMHMICFSEVGLLPGLQAPPFRTSWDLRNASTPGHSLQDRHTSGNTGAEETTSEKATQSGLSHPSNMQINRRKEISKGQRDM